MRASTIISAHVPLLDSRSSDPACLSVLTLVWRALLTVTCFTCHKLFVGQKGVQRALVKTSSTTYYPRTHSNHLVISWTCAGKETSYVNAKHHTFLYACKFMLLLPLDTGTRDRRIAFSVNLRVKVKEDCSPFPQSVDTPFSSQLLISQSQVPVLQPVLSLQYCPHT